MSKTMTFEDYNDFLMREKEKIEVLDRRIWYRHIQLIGRTPVPTFTLIIRPEGNITDDEKRILDNDDVLRSLKKIREDANNVYEYVKTYGKLPMYMDEIRQEMRVREMMTINDETATESLSKRLFEESLNHCCCECEKEESKNEEKSRT